MAEVTSEVNVTCPLCGEQQTIRVQLRPDGIGLEFIHLPAHEPNDTPRAGSDRGVRPA